MRPEGLPAGVIAERLGVQPSSPSFDLAQLVHADLITQRYLSRQLIYSVSGSGVSMTAFGHDPSAQFLSVSYAQDLADKLARDCRALMMSPCFLRFQKESALALWYRVRTADRRTGTRKTMIVALARKLVIALWRS